MAKITITIEDNQVTGGVKVVSDPSFESMAKMDNSGEGLTSAHGYALTAINHIRKVAKENTRDRSSLKVNIPKIVKPY